jgi:hypothetical protein
MKYLDLLLNLIISNPGESLAIILGAASAASTLCEMVGWTKASKWLGTATLDGGRLVRLAKRGIAIRKALSGLLVVGLAACSGPPPQIPTVCPVSPAAVASAVQAAQGVVEQAQAVAADPSASGLAVVAAQALDTVSPICDELDSAPCRDAVAKARVGLSQGETTREQVCGVVAVLVAVVPIEKAPAELVAARELCR